MYFFVYEPFFPFSYFSAKNCHKLSVLLYYAAMNKSEENQATQEALDESLKEMCNLISKNNNPKLIYDFFECLFTKAELKDFAMRWLLVKEIDKGTTQRDIAKKFSMSLCKITRGSKELKKPDSAFRRFLDLAEKI